MKKKLEHIWYYYKWYILAAALVILVAANFVGELGQRRQPDGVVSIVTTSQVPEETVEEIRTLFETLWGDRNQDGVTDVEVNVYAYDGMGYSGGSADDYAAAAVHLASEIQAGTTDLFLSDAEELMRQAERLQYYGAFREGIDTETEMDGLTMLEQMKNELANSRVIFITAYDKIEYAARAIRLSAFDFLMKPVKNEDLIQSLDRAVQSMDRENSKIEKQAKEQTILRRARFLSALTAGSMEDIAHAFSGFVTGIPQNYFFMIAETESHVTEPISRMEFMTFPENVEILNVVLNHQLVMLCAMTGESGHWQSTARSIAATLQENFLGLTVAVSNLYSRPEDFYVAYQECRCALLRHDINGRTARVEFAYDLEGDALKHTRIEELDHGCEKIAQHITDIDPERLWSMILKKSGGNIRIIRTTLWLLCTKVIRSKLEQHQWTEEADMIVYDITKITREQEARDWLLRFLEEANRNTSGQNHRSNLVRNVLEYIRGHITDGLVLEEVAKKFYVSPNYLSCIIHKETGKTYRQHVIEAKMTVAKQMLNDTRMRVEDVAYAVGYENYISFYNVFKRIEHMSPSEYRFQKWNGEQL